MLDKGGSNPKFTMNLQFQAVSKKLSEWICHYRHSIQGAQETRNQKWLSALQHPYHCQGPCWCWAHSIIMIMFQWRKSSHILCQETVPIQSEEWQVCSYDSDNIKIGNGGFSYQDSKLKHIAHAQILKSSALSRSLSLTSQHLFNDSPLLHPSIYILPSINPLSIGHLAFWDIWAIWHYYQPLKLSR